MRLLRGLIPSITGGLLKPACTVMKIIIIIIASVPTNLSAKGFSSLSDQFPIYYYMCYHGIPVMGATDFDILN